MLKHLEPPAYRVKNPKQVNIKTTAPPHTRENSVHLVKKVPRAFYLSHKSPPRTAVNGTVQAAVG
jgi:hypothetical protein